MWRVVARRPARTTRLQRPVARTLGRLSTPNPVQQHLLLTRYNPTRVATGDMMSVDDVKEILGIDVLGVIPESEGVLAASNAGVPVILDETSSAGQAYEDAIARLLGEDRPMRFLDAPKKGILSRLFGS